MKFQEYNTQQIIDRIKTKALIGAMSESDTGSGSLSGIDYDFAERESIINVNNKGNNVNNGIAPKALMDSPLATQLSGDSRTNVSAHWPVSETNTVAAKASDLASNTPNEEETGTNGFADDDADASIAYDYDAEDSEEIPDTIIAAVRVDFFDNGEKSMAGKKKSTRYKANVQVKFPGDISYTKFPCSFNNRTRDFLATITDDQKQDPWYMVMMDILKEMREKGTSGEVDYSLAPIAGKLRDANNHVIEHAAVFLFQINGETFPRAYVAIDTFDQEIILNLPPKGKPKCPQLMAVGLYRNPDYLEDTSEKKTSGLTFQEAMAAAKKPH